MSQYFYDCMTEEELEQLPYLPTLADLLEKGKREYASRPAVGTLTCTYTYGELYKRVAKRRRFLREVGLRAGDRVAVLARNGLDAMEWYLAIPTAGCTLLMLPNALPASAVAGISVRFDLAALLCEECFAEAAVGVSCPVYPSSAIAETEEPMGTLTKDTVAAIYFTGGTTGAPKGAVLTHGALMRGALNGCYQPGQVFGNRYLAMLPLSHIFGSVRGFLSPLYTGSLVYTCEDMRAGVASIPVLRPTVLVLVPGMAELILNLAKLKGKGFLGDLHTIISGAAPVPPRLMAAFREFDIALLAGYGLTEAANLTSGNYRTEEKPDSVGKFYPEQEYRIVDGELWLRGDNLMLGYYDDPEKTAEVMTEDGWLRTGDLAEVDEDGYLYIVGRIKNLILLDNGENVSPEELEELFYKNPLVKDCLVYEDTLNGRNVIAAEIFPYLPAFAKASSEEIEARLWEVAEAINAQLPSYKRVSKLIVRQEEFPRTGAMKIARK